MEKQLDIIANQICSKFDFVESITDEGEPEYDVYENEEGIIIGRDQNCLFTEL